MNSIILYNQSKIKKIVNLKSKTFLESYNEIYDIMFNTNDRTKFSRIDWRSDEFNLKLLDKKDGKYINDQLLDSADDAKINRKFSSLFSKNITNSKQYTYGNCYEVSGCFIIRFTRSTEYDRLQIENSEMLIYDIKHDDDFSDVLLKINDNKFIYNCPSLIAKFALVDIIKSVSYLEYIDALDSFFKLKDILCQNKGIYYDYLKTFISIYSYLRKYGYDIPLIYQFYKNEIKILDLSINNTPLYEISRHLVENFEDIYPCIDNDLDNYIDKIYQMFKLSANFKLTYSESIALLLKLFLDKKDLIKCEKVTYESLLGLLKELSFSNISILSYNHIFEIKLNENTLHYFYKALDVEKSEEIKNNILSMIDNFSINEFINYINRLGSKRYCASIRDAISSKFKKEIKNLSLLQIVDIIQYVKLDDETNEAIFELMNKETKLSSEYIILYKKLVEKTSATHVASNLTLNNRYTKTKKKLLFNNLAIK